MIQLSCCCIIGDYLYYEHLLAYRLVRIVTITIFLLVISAVQHNVEPSIVTELLKGFEHANHFTEKRYMNFFLDLLMKRYAIKVYCVVKAFEWEPTAIQI